MLMTLGLTIALFMLAMLGLAIGMLFSRRCLFGSCQSANRAVIGPDGKPLSCGACPNRDKPDHDCDEEKARRGEKAESISA